MPECIECDTPVEATAAKNSYEKYDDVYCQECRRKIEVDEPLPSEIEGEGGHEPPEQTDQQTYNVGGESDDVPVMSAAGNFKKADTPMNEIAPTNQPCATAPPETQLDMKTIKTYICPTATDREAYAFLQLCTARNLNPFTKEAYLIKYGTGAATIIVGKDAFMRRAEEHPMFDGFEAGIIVNSGEDGMYDVIDEREGTLMYEGERLLGGWCKVYRKDHKYPMVSRVSMKEYDTGKSTWLKIPATMICKVAKVQSLRESFPSDLGGCYDSSEMGVEI